MASSSDKSVTRGGVSLAERLAQKGWQPGRADVPGLLALLAGERGEAELAERALARLPSESAERLVRDRFAASAPPLRARLCRLMGRLAADEETPERRLFLRDALADRDEKTRRNAAVALGKLAADAETEARLVAAWAGAGVEEKRSLAEALGKAGGARARALLADAGDEGDARLGALLGEARLRLGRTLDRAQARGRVRGEVPLPPGTVVELRCREGVGELLAEEAAEVVGAAAVEQRGLRPQASGLRAGDADVVRVRTSASLETLFRCRTALRAEVPLVAPQLRGARAKELGPDALAEAVVGAVTAPATRRLLAALTEGPVRWRLEWADAGHRRGLTYRIAAQVAERAPELVNDPTDSLWEVVVRERPSLSMSVWARGLPDPRFAWRTVTRPASSHPTLAAALARLGGVRDGDRVWDPFVGTAAELVECARRAPGATLHGSDLLEEALAGARENLAAAGVTATLARADATRDAPPFAPTLIVTNPPMGRRVLDRHGTRALLPAFLAHAARVLAPGGRLAWISPRGDETAAAAAEVGLRARVRRRVDMGGFSGELQLLVREHR